MAPLRTVLVFTCPEHGQANANLATSYELALAGVNVCIASFGSLETRVLHLQELVAGQRDAAGPDSRPTGHISFRECKGIRSVLDIAFKPGEDVTTLQHPHGVSGALKNYAMLDILAFPWSLEEHLAAIETIKEVIATVESDVVVIDKSFQVAMDACYLAGRKFIIMFPNSIKDAVVHLQPHFAAFWKYPVFVRTFLPYLTSLTSVSIHCFDSVSSGFSFPLKWWQIPLNIYLNIRLIIRIMSSVRVKQILALRRSLGIKHIFTMQFCPGVPHICPALPEIDFPLAVIPEEMVLCGPIIMPFDPIEESDPALAKWLDNGPTVLINLGSHVTCDEKLSREMTSAFRILLDYHGRKSTSKVQVLWKAKANEDVRKIIDDIAGKEMEEGRVKVVPWLDAEPVAILQHPNVVCTVHHGGANSFFEGVWSGMPHVVLPVWTDTYDYANRAEFLNIGIFASKTSAPSVRAEELGQALVRVTGNTEEAVKFRAAAKRLKEVCRAKGNGRKLSSDAILKEIGVTN